MSSYSAEDIDPSFIFISPTVMTKSHVTALESYKEPLEPLIIPYFDYAKQREETIKKAKAFIDRLKPRLKKCSSKFDEIFTIMRSGYLRAGTITQTKFDENYEPFKKIINRAIKANKPLEFTLPSFPFKFANPIKLARKSPDMAEVLCLSRMYEICTAIGLQYEPGARFIIIADGQVYHHMFGVTLYEAISYRETSKKMLRDLEYDDCLEIVDMQDVIKNKHQEFSKKQTQLRGPFSDWWASEKNNTRKMSLIKSSANNINTELSISHDLTKLATSNILHEPDTKNLLNNIAKIRKAILDRSDLCAFEFSLFLYALRELNLVNVIYPDSIRCTVHPKPGQWGLHLVNKSSRIFPWHGVAFKDKHKRWKIKYELETIRDSILPVHIEGELFPFYYQEA